MKQPIAPTIRQPTTNRMFHSNKKEATFVADTTKTKATNNTNTINNINNPNGTNPQRIQSLRDSTDSEETMISLMEDAKVFGIHIWRLACAFGIVYVISEYGVELTICEGPSMVPTIRPQGEIVLLDRWTPRIFGLQGGSNGTERARLARQFQSQYAPKADIWYEPRIPVNQYPSTFRGTWGRFWHQVTTGISVGDVVVVQHPDRIGTVCKRVVGLPGDIVTKPSPRMSFQTTLSKKAMGTTSTTTKLQRRRSMPRVYMVIPDGHIWMEGDNPWNSSDSRTYGPVPASLIVGRVLLRIWPLRGHALMERGARPSHARANRNDNDDDDNDDDDDYQDTSSNISGSLVLPAGYQNERLITSLKSWKEEMLQSRQ